MKAQTNEHIIEELKAMASRVMAYKNERGISYAKLTEELPEVGSDKTLNLLLKGQVEGLDLETQFNNYTICVAQIDSSTDQPEEQPYENSQEPGLNPDMTLAKKLRSMFVRLMKVTDINRFGAIIMDGGGGKTSAAKLLQSKWKSRVKPIEVLVVWGDSTGAMLHDLCELLRVREIPASTHGKYREVKARLRAKRTALIFDEAHYLSPNSLSCIINLMNETPGEFIMLAKTLLWKKLMRLAYEACDQLQVNRLDELAKYTELPVSDYMNLVVTHLAHLGEQERLEAATGLSIAASERGHLAFARDAISKAIGDSKGKPVTIPMLTTAAQEVARKLGKASL